MIVIAHITRVADGVTRRTEHEYANSNDSIVFHWTDGNYGCDCNRHLFFERAGGCESAGDECVCGADRYRVALEFGGKKISDL